MRLKSTCIWASLWLGRSERRFRVCVVWKVTGSACTCDFHQYRLVYEFVFITCSSVLHKFFWAMEMGRKREKIAIYLWMSSPYEKLANFHSFRQKVELAHDPVDLISSKVFFYEYRLIFFLCQFVCYYCYYISTKTGSASSTRFVCPCGMQLKLK